ncbi:MAG: ATP-binding cassette domain-containing protein, partial [Pseudomonadales bacterium]
MPIEFVIEIRDMSFARGDRVIFEHLNMQVRKGKVTAIMGPSGTGKTTLLRIIGGQIKPDQGEVIVCGRNVSELSRGELFELRQDMGMLFQSS